MDNTVLKGTKLERPNRKENQSGRIIARRTETYHERLIECEHDNKFDCQKFRHGPPAFELLRCETVEHQKPIKSYTEIHDSPSKKWAFFVQQKVQTARIGFALPYADEVDGFDVHTRPVR